MTKADRDFCCLDGRSIFVHGVADPSHVTVTGAVPAILQDAVGHRALAAIRLAAKPFSPRARAWEAQHHAVLHHASYFAVVFHEVLLSKVPLPLTLPHFLLMLPHGVCRNLKFGSFDDLSTLLTPYKMVD